MPVSPAPPHGDPPTATAKRRGPSIKGAARPHPVTYKSTPNDYAACIGAAHQRGLSPGEFIREVLISTLTRPSPTERVLLERLAALLTMFKLGIRDYGDPNLAFTRALLAALGHTADASAHPIIRQKLARIADGQDPLPPVASHAATANSGALTHTLTARLTKGEYIRAKEAAETQGLTLSAWCRRTVRSALNRPHPIDRLLLVYAEALRYVGSNLLAAFLSHQETVPLTMLRATLPHVEHLTETKPNPAVTPIIPVPDQKARTLLDNPGLQCAFPVLHPDVTAPTLNTSAGTLIRPRSNPQGDVMK